MTKKLDTKLESEGAEFLVLGQLLLNRIAAYKTYTNMPGYDLIATNPEANTSARIQVKSRWRTGATGFPISRFDCDFVVTAFLNRGSKDGTKQVKAPDFFVIPVDVVKGLPRDSHWSKVDLKHVPELDQYKDSWQLISQFLSKCHGTKDKAG